LTQFAEMYGVTGDQAAQFFYGHLEKKVSRNVPESEVRYVAALLSSYAQVSCSSANFSAPPRSLVEIFDRQISLIPAADGFNMPPDSETLETAGKQILFLVGFFRDQMPKRHNLDWYDQLRETFFSKAGKWNSEEKKARLLRRIGENFPMWAVCCCQMSRTLQEERYLLKLD
jgi:hypothetical protein